MIRGKMMSCFRYLIQGTPILYIIKNKLSSVFYKKNLKFLKIFCRIIFNAPKKGF